MIMMETVSKINVFHKCEYMCYGSWSSKTLVLPGCSVQAAACLFQTNLAN